MEGSGRINEWTGAKGCGTEDIMNEEIEEHNKVVLLIKLLLSSIYFARLQTRRIYDHKNSSAGS